MTKLAKKTVAATRFTASQRTLLATAMDIGANVADGFNAAVRLFGSIGQKNGKAVEEAARLYRIGYLARYLANVPAYAKRWGNMDAAAIQDAAAAIIGRASPDSSKADRRTDVEHKAVRAADVSISTAKKRAGFVATKKGNRAPRAAGSNKSAPSVKVDLVKASPAFSDKKAANDHFATACAALLATCNKNAKLLDPRLTSAVTDFHSALKELGLISKTAK